MLLNYNKGNVEDIGNGACEEIIMSPQETADGSPRDSSGIASSKTRKERILLMGKNKSKAASKRRNKQGFKGDDTSRIKHDVRNELIIVREGISQVLDGLGAKDCNKCCEILKPALKHADKLYEIIDELFSAPDYKTKLKDNKSATALLHSESHDFKKLRNEYVDRLAHLLRTPLSIANEALALVVDGIAGELNPKQKDMVALLKNNMIRLNKSIEHILSTHGTVKK